jgi:hypothetical protein
MASMPRDSLILGTAWHIDHAASREAARSEGEARAKSNRGSDAA